MSEENKTTVIKKVIKKDVEDVKVSNEDNYVLEFVENPNAKRKIVKKDFPTLIMDTYNIMGNDDYINLNNPFTETDEDIEKATVVDLEREKALQDILEESKQYLVKKNKGGNFIVGVSPYTIESLGQEIFSTHATKRILKPVVFNKKYEDINRKDKDRILEILNMSEDDKKVIRDFEEQNEKELVKQGKSVLLKYRSDKKDKEYLDKIEKYDYTEDELTNLRTSYGDNIYWFIWGATNGKWNFKVDKQNENFYSGEMRYFTEDGKFNEESKKALVLNFLKHFVKEGDTLLIVNNQEGSIIEEVALEYGCHIAKLSSKGGVI